MEMVHFAQKHSHRNLDFFPLESSFISFNLLLFDMVGK